MPSYKLVPIPKGEAETHNIEEVAENLSIWDDTKDRRRGIIPETLTRHDTDPGITWFKYGIEEEFTYPTIEGETQAQDYCNKSTVGLIQDSFFIIGDCNKKEHRESILELLELQLVADGISLEYESFTQGELEYVVNEGVRLLKVALGLTDPSEPDLVQAFDRDELRDTNIVKKLREDGTLEQVKVELQVGTQTPSIGFKKDGTITFYEWSRPLAEQMYLAYRMTPIIAKLSSTTFQTTLERVNESKSAPG